MLAGDEGGEGPPMSNRQTDPPVPGRQVDPRQMTSQPILSLASNMSAPWQDILVREFHCDLENVDLAVPPTVEDCLAIQTGGWATSRGRVVRPFRLHIAAEDIFLVPHGVPTEWRISGRYDALQLYLSPALMAAVAQQALDADPGRVELRERATFRDPLIYAIGLELRAEVISDGLAGRLYTESLAHTLAVHLLRDHAIFPPRPPRLAYDLSGPVLRRVVDYVNANLAHDLSLAEIAAVVHFSPYHLTRLFKRAVGVSLHQYVIAQRVAAARRLIVAGRLPLAEIAAYVGFADQSHLTRHFKRLQGVSPVEFVRQRKNIQSPRTNLQDPSSPEELY